MKKISICLILAGVFGLGGCTEVSERELDLRAKYENRHMLHYVPMNKPRNLTELEMWNDSYEREKRLDEEGRKKMEEGARWRPFDPNQIPTPRY